MSELNYTVQDREAGNFIASYPTEVEAIQAIDIYEAEDMAEGTYTPNFYEIVEVEV